MIFFWIIITFMTLLALGFILIPLLPSPKKSHLNQNDLNIALYKIELSLLDEQLKKSAISLQQYQELHQELTASLLEDVPASKTSLVQTEPNRWLLLTLMILLPIIAITLYLHWGNSRQLAQSLAAKQQTAMIQAEIAKLGPPENIIKTLQQKLEQNPTSAQGWYLLGRLYLSQRQWHKAVIAFAKADQIKPNSNDIMLQYAESLFFLNHNQLNEKAQKLISAILLRSPQDINALNLLALNAYYQKHYLQAIHYWQTLLAQVVPGSDDSKTLLAMIDEAKKHLPSVNKIKLTVRVDLANNLKNKIGSDASVFIYAKALNGPSAPLAVVRKQVRDLPITVTLDQHDAMVPTETIDDFARVQIFARISKSGQVMTQKGDLQGQSQIINTQRQKNKVAVLINKIID